jgi:hypothetical protein
MVGYGQLETLDAAPLQAYKYPYFGKKISLDQGAEEVSIHCTKIYP